MAARKAIFVTGGASGIGRAVAIHFANKGWFVGLADINRKGMEETAAQLPKGQSALYDLDVRDGAQWKAALEGFWKASGGRLDVMFNNAGIGKGGPFAEVAPADRCRDQHQPCQRFSQSAALRSSRLRHGFLGVLG